MTNTYRFVGLASLIRDHAELKQLGQQVVLADDQAEIVMRGGCALNTAAEFEHGFTAAETKQYAFAGAQLNAPAEFQERLQAARQIAADRINALQAGASFQSLFPAVTAEEVN